MINPRDLLRSYLKDRKDGAIFRLFRYIQLH